MERERERREREESGVRGIELSFTLQGVIVFSWREEGQSCRRQRKISRVRRVTGVTFQISTELNTLRDASAPHGLHVHTYVRTYKNTFAKWRAYSPSRHETRHDTDLSFSSTDETPVS